MRERGRVSHDRRANRRVQRDAPCEARLDGGGSAQQESSTKAALVSQPAASQQRRRQARSSTTTRMVLVQSGAHSSRRRREYACVQSLAARRRHQDAAPPAIPYARDLRQTCALRHSSHLLQACEAVAREARGAYCRARSQARSEATSRMDEGGPCAQGRLQPDVGSRAGRQ